MPAPAPDPRLLEEQKRLDALLHSLGNVSRQLQEQQRQRLGELQQVAIELAVALASRLVHERIEAGEFAVEEVVRQVVHPLAGAPSITVYLHPDDLALLEQRLGDSAELKGRTATQFVPEASLARGDCRAETGDLQVVSAVREQLAGMRQELLSSVAAADGERRGTGPGAGMLRRFPDRRQTA